MFRASVLALFHLELGLTHHMEVPYQYLLTIFVQGFHLKYVVLKKRDIFRRASPQIHELLL